MLKKTLIATATTALIAAGGIAATTGTASAGNYGVHINNSGVHFSYQPNGHRHNYQPTYKRICKPVFRKVRWYDYYGRPHWKKVRAGVRCETVRYQQPHQKPYQQPRQNRHNGYSYQYGW